VTNFKHLTDKEFRLLSAYLDDELTEQERENCRILLAANPHAAPTLENLRNLRSLLRFLPELTVPHQFTLTHLEAQPDRPGWMELGLRVLSGLSAVALTVVLAIDLLVPFRSVPQPAMVESAPMEDVPDVKTMVEEKDAEEPMVFNFQAEPPGMGLGGGGSPADKPGQIPGAIIPDISITEGEMEEEPVLRDETQETFEMESAEIDTKGDQGPGPILGVRPAEEQADVSFQEIPIEIPLPEPVYEQPLDIILVLEIALVTMFAVSALAAFLIRRKRRRL